MLEAIDGEQGLRLAEAERPDLIVTDIVMPKMDGYQFVHHLRKGAACHQMPVIFCTAAYEERGAPPGKGLRRISHAELET